MKIAVNPIGEIRSPYDRVDRLARQAILNRNQEASIIIYDDYLEGIEGIEKGDFIEIIFYFHKSEKELLTVKSKKNDLVSGVFSTRAPHRPNHIGVSIVEVIGVNGNKISFKGVDMLNRTPVLDIKPMNEGLIFSEKI